MDHTLPWLRYVDADEMDDETIDFDDMQVESPSGEHLGNVDGFIVDSHSGRPYYVVVDSGGWFRSKHFLMPVGHVRFNADEETMVVDADRDRVEKFPGFDKDEFDKLSVDDLKRLNDDTCQACSIEGVAIVYATDEPFSAAWDRPAYRYPDWWHAGPTLPDRMGANAVTAGAENAPRPALARERSTMEPGRVVAHDADPSPHLDGRAQPGDVIGVETGGERTYVGDSAEDENERRRQAEEENAKNRE